MNAKPHQQDPSENLSTPANEARPDCVEWLYKENFGAS